MILGLVLKDILVQRKQLFLILGAWIAMSPLYVEGAYPIIVFWAFLIAIGYSNRAFLQDETSRCEVVLNSLPVSRRDIVAARYLTALVLVGCAALIMLILNALVGVGDGDRVGLPFWALLEVSIVLALLSISLFFPVYFRFGFARSKWVSGIAFGMVGAFIALLLKASPAAHDHLFRNVLGGFTGMFTAIQVSVVAIFFIALMSISVLLSIRFYQTREF